MAVKRGRHFFQNPGPTNIPDRVLRAMDRPTIDFNTPEFIEIREEAHAGLKRVLKTEQIVLTYAASGHGAWHASTVNLFSPGDHVLVPETGYFSINWGAMAKELGLKVEVLPGDWRKGVDPAAVEARLRQDTGREIKAVMLVHNETSTGATHPVAEVRAGIDRAGHPALFMVDTISSLASIDFRMDEWKIDLVVGGGQKGLMLPSGLCFTGISRKGLGASQSAQMPRGYWDWRPLLTGEKQTKWPGTAPVHLYYGLQESVRMLEEEGLDQVYRRHHRLGEATRVAVRVWAEGGGPELYPTNPDIESDSVTAVLMPEGHDPEAIRKICMDKFNVSLGGGLGALNGKVFRIGHLGDLNEPMILGALAAVEMALSIARVPHRRGGVDAAMAYLAAD
jgi:alanine-glyoxylate transaminase / serine-glyoxylate transaminase / serine-pyruvate transaminase